MNPDPAKSRLRYAVDERPPALLAAGLGLQVVVIVITGIVLVPTVVLRAAGDPGGFIPWAVFAGLVVSGLSTMLQARPIWRFGAGYVLFMGTSGAFIAVSIDAVTLGGVPLLATLIVASSLIQFLFAYHLSALRKVVTPTVGGTVIMLIAVTIFPVVFRMINETPQGLPEDSSAGPMIATATFTVILGIALFAKGATRLWGPIAGIVVGYAAAVGYGAFDLSAVAAAQWIGLPEATWPGFDLTFGADFWWLLAPFSIVTIVGAVETFGGCVAIQRLSKRTKDPIDFRSVQGAVNADGLGNLLSGLAGTLPNTSYAVSISVADLTGVAARQVGLWCGLFLMLLAFCPKLAMFLISIPTPVAGAYIMVVITLSFMHGLRLVTEDGLSYENGVIVCVAFWLAVGFQNQNIFAEHLPSWTRGLLDNGMTAGGIVVIVLTLLVRLRKGRDKRIQVPASTAAIAEVHRFLAELGGAAGWDHSAVMRLELVGEEAMLFLLDQPTHAERTRDRQVHVSARASPRRIDLEFTSGTSGVQLDNAARRIDWEVPPSQEDAGLRILQGLADKVRHEQYHGVDVLIVGVESRPL